MLRRFAGSINKLGFSQNLVNSLVAYYNLDGNANDAFSTNNGTEVGTITYGNGIDGQAPLFNDVSKLIEIPDSDVFSFTDGVNDLPFSISMWVYYDAFSSSANYFIMKRRGSNDEWVFYRFGNNGRIHFTKFSNSSNFQQINGILAQNINQWYHVVITDDGSKTIQGMNIYINSILRSKNDASIGTYTGMTNGTSKVTMGGFATNQPNFRHQGLIDLVGIWKNRELTQSDVDELYNNGSGLKYT